MGKHRLFEPEDNDQAVVSFENAILRYPSFCNYSGQHRQIRTVFNNCTNDNCRANCCK